MGCCWQPVDIEPLFETVGPEESIRVAVEVVLEDKSVDSVVILFMAVPRLIPFFNMKDTVKFTDAQVSRALKYAWNATNSHVKPRLFKAKELEGSS
jgi:hypothetical protein